MENEMLEFRIHGRGGQGIVVAAAIFAEAVFMEGYYARAFSLFGAERRGAPVTAFIRAGKNRLMPRSRVHHPDYVAIFDSTMTGASLVSGLKKSGTLLLNSKDDCENSLTKDIPRDMDIKTFSVDATDIAWKHNLAIGSFPMVNTVMLGAMAHNSGMASLDSLVESIRKRVSARLEENIAAVKEGFESVKVVGSFVN